MYQKNMHPLITGTMVLTLAGFLSRIIGFFYRIFLSQTIGAEGIGIYQLASPLLVICFSLASSGIQTAISRFVAAACPKNGTKFDQTAFLYCGCFISFSISVFLSCLLFFYAEFIADTFIMEARCAPLIQILAFSLPLESLHACINGFYFGIKESKLPALSQLVEQIARVGFVFFFFSYLNSQTKPLSLSIIVCGTIVGELFSVLLCITSLRQHLPAGTPHIRLLLSSLPLAKKLIAFALPLTLNRTIISLLCSVEAICIPSRLQLYGYAVSDSLSIYGILTGMALPLILFPSAITNSAAVMLLPIVSESEASGNKQFLLKTIQRTIGICLLVGAFCTLGFLILGDFAGYLLFHNQLAGSFITTLSFICPFLYLNTTLSSILHGLGKTTTAFFISCTGILTRLLFTFFLIPQIGIRGFLYGLLVCTMLTALLYLAALKGAGYPLFSFVNNLKLKKNV